MNCFPLNKRHHTHFKKSVAFIYTNNEQFKKEIKKTISFTIAPKNSKNVGINLVKEVKDLYTKNQNGEKKTPKYY